MLDVRRREFMALLGGTAAWPLTARAQQGERMRRIGFLQGLAENDPETEARGKAFRQGLAALGWTEGRDIWIEYRYAAGDTTRIKAYAAELVNSAPDLIVANGSPVVAALKQATRTIPIVFSVINDPAGQGFVANLARPGGNITGFSYVDFPMIGKWLEILKETVPGQADDAHVQSRDRALLSRLLTRLRSDRATTRRGTFGNACAKRGGD